MKRFFYVFLAVIIFGLFSYASVNSAIYPSTTTASGSNIFVLFAGIAGQSTEGSHRDWVEASSIRNQITGTPFTGDIRTSGRANFEFTVVKNIDKASPKLNLLCASGQLLQEVVIDLVRPGSAIVYMNYKLLNVKVVSVNSEAINGETTETVTLGFSRISATYTDVDPMGRVRGKVSFGWDIPGNREMR